jgi:excinuclease UvrABC nuclease subunit
LIQCRQFAEGLRVIESGIDSIRDFLDEYQQSERAEQCAELLSLEHWRDEIIAQEQEAAAARPQTATEVLRRKLEEAIAAEEFEEAARLRDEIRRLHNPGVSEGG